MHFAGPRGRRGLLQGMRNNALLLARSRLAKFAAQAGRQSSTCISVQAGSNSPSDFDRVLRLRALLALGDQRAPKASDRAP